MTDPDLRQAMSVDHIGVDLWRALRAYEEAMFQAVAAAGHDVTLADGDVLAFVGPDGTRSSEIARNRRVSKQAAQEQVQRLVRRGYLEITADPEDRRAKRVTLTEKGATLMRDFVGVKETLHSRVVAAIGPNDAAKLREMLATIRSALG